MSVSEELGYLDHVIYKMKWKKMVRDTGDFWIRFRKEYLKSYFREDS